MSLNPFNNLPPLSKEEALSILSTPFKNLESCGDYYKAVYHLSNYPCDQTEKELLKLLELNGNQLEVRMHCFKL